jgi:hypothetical protein
MTLFVGTRGVQGIECNRLDFNLGSIQVLFTCVLANMSMRCNGKNLCNVNRKNNLNRFFSRKPQKMYS